MAFFVGTESFLVWTEKNLNWTASGVTSKVEREKFD